jgi:protein import protein ZIM17
MEDGKLKTVEDLLKAKGEKIRKGRVNMDGTIEYEGE